MKSKILVLNWKMNPASEKEAETLFSFIKKHAKRPLVIAPPFVYLYKFSARRDSKLKIAAQDVFYADKGAFTGEVSAGMLKDAGVWGCIVGHSERRVILKESDILIKKKLQAVTKDGIAPILCVGEREKESVYKAWAYVRGQLEKDLPEKLPGNMLIAYEPVWSIGGDKETDANHSEKIIGLIKKYIKKEFGKKIGVLYGGSINCGNIAQFLKFDTIDGFLVGSASLRKEEISCIINKINN